MVDRFERFSFAISEISRCWHKLAAEEMEKYACAARIACICLPCTTTPAASPPRSWASCAAEIRRMCPA